MAHEQNETAIDSGEIIHTREKYLIAVLAGITPIATKYLARDSDQNIIDLLPIYSATAICLITLGIIVCYLSDEKNKMKLFMLALSAPALISNLSSNSDTQNLRAEIQNPFSMAAYASEAPKEQITVYAGFVDNVKRYFGNPANSESKGFWVIVHSTKNKAEAEQVAAQINQIDPRYNAFVGNRRPNNPFYPVIVGNQNNQTDAKKLARSAKELESRIAQINDQPYLDNYPNRR